MNLVLLYILFLQSLPFIINTIHESVVQTNQIKQEEVILQ